MTVLDKLTRSGGLPRASVLAGVLLAQLCAAPGCAAAQASEVAEVDRPAVLAPLAAKSLLLAVAVAGPRIVAVGERGHVLHSDDQGRSWTQAAAVPTRSTLTGVCFRDAQHGFAVGHDEVILATADGGDHWSGAHYSPESQQPLLDVWCGAGARAIAVGAYGAMYVTADGVTWHSRKLDATPLVAAPAPKAAREEGPPPDFHLNRIAAVAGRLYLAAESGHLYRSDDDGQHWVALPSPYEGSFYGVLPLGGDALLAYGLRGRLFRSADAGLSWQRLDSRTEAMLDDAARLPDGTIVLVGLSGVVVVSRDGGATFELEQQADRKGLAALVGAGDGRIVAAGEGGVRVIDISKGSGR